MSLLLCDVFIVQISRLISPGMLLVVLNCAIFVLHSHIESAHWMQLRLDRLDLCMLDSVCTDKPKQQWQWHAQCLTHFLQKWERTDHQHHNVHSCGHFQCKRTINFFSILSRSEEFLHEFKILPKKYMDNVLYIFFRLKKMVAYFLSHRVHPCAYSILKSPDSELKISQTRMEFQSKQALLCIRFKILEQQFITCKTILRYYWAWPGLSENFWLTF